MASTDGASINMATPRKTERRYRSDCGPTLQRVPRSQQQQLLGSSGFTPILLKPMKPRKQKLNGCYDEKKTFAYKKKNSNQRQARTLHSKSHPSLSMVTFLAGRAANHSRDDATARHVFTPQTPRVCAVLVSMLSVWMPF